MAKRSPERSASAIAKGKEKPVKPLRRFRILSGIHAMSIKDGVTGQRTQLLYGPKQKDGTIIETRDDLNRFNQPNSRRYEEIGFEEKRGPTRDDFDNMTKRALLDFIEDENEGLPEEAQFQVDPKWNKYQLVEALRKHVPAARLAEYRASKEAEASAESDDDEAEDAGDEEETEE